MLPAVFLAFCIAGTAALGFLILSSFKQDIARVFPEDYKTLKQAHPYPLKTFRFVSGSLRAKTVLPLRFRGERIQFPNTLRCKGTLKLDLYSHMLVVSTLGRAICLRYGEHDFKREQFGFFSSLSVANLPVREKSGAELFPNPVEFDRTTTLTVQLSPKRLDDIAALIRQAQGAPQARQ